MKKAVILGMGASGKAVAKLLQKHHIDFLVFDDDIPIYENWAKAENIKPFDLKKESLKDVCDKLIVSPGVSPKHFLFREALLNGIKVVGEAEIGLQYLDGKMIAITGTNGKTTVTLLCEHILNKAGICARAIGNVGLPICEYALNPKKEEVLVLELSSYQLDTMHSVKFETAALLNVTPDHLDRYDTMENYARSKAHLQDLVINGGRFFVYEQVKEEFGNLFFKESLFTYGRKNTSSLWTDKSAIWEGEQKVCELTVDKGETGIHDSENILAAYALLKPFNIPAAVFNEAIASFKKPSHRIEFVTEFDGIKFYDDSKGTNIDAVIKACNAIDAPIVLIAGGVDKGYPYTPWIEALSKRVKKIITIGQAAEKIENELSHVFSVEKAVTMQEAVEKAKNGAREGDCVLLSPGCSSFDMFKDYAHRGQEFQRSVLNLQMRRKSS